MKKGIRDLKIGDTILAKDDKDKDIILTYKGMDGGYAKLHTKNGKFAYASGYVFKKKGEKHYRFTSVKETK